jgi:hypothetical protein
VFVAIKEKNDKANDDLSYNIAIPLGPLPEVLRR